MAAIENLFAPQLVADCQLAAESLFPAVLGQAQMTGGLIPPSVSSIDSSSSSSYPFYSFNADAPSDSGVTVVGSAAKKRTREQPLFFLGDELSALFQQQMLDIDILLARSRETIRMELAERRKRFSRQLAGAVEKGVRKRLKAKEEEMDSLKKLNWALEERLRSDCAQNQIWSELVQTKEATTSLLRTNLEQILEQQQQQQPCDEAAVAADDGAESFSGSNDDIGAPAAAEEASELRVVRACWNCCVREPSVLLLPCCHLCLCAVCSVGLIA
ncbi:hypothetical protein KSP39_PZI002947 [Platanthera zijinensis]|uniref:BOI-related E3 ubiquitin-protein ligase 3 n=1 Tax=Platanthera zijinensis TaxID=2320716 RepID=A0AAP0BZS7_9ASPA